MAIKKIRKDVQELFRKIEDERLRLCDTTLILEEVCKRIKLSDSEKEQAFDKLVEKDNYMVDKKFYLEQCAEDLCYKLTFPTLKSANEFYRLCTIGDLKDGPTAKTAGRKKIGKKQEKVKK